MKDHSFEPVRCNSCDDYLMDAPPGSSCFCPKCQVWIDVEGKKKAPSPKTRGNPPTDKPE